MRALPPGHLAHMIEMSIKKEEYFFAFAIFKFRPGHHSCYCCIPAFTSWNLRCLRQPKHLCFQNLYTIGIIKDSGILTSGFTVISPTSQEFVSRQPLL